MSRSNRRVKPAAAIAALVVSAGVGASAASAQSDGTVKLTPLPTGAMPKMGGYMPQRVNLSSEKPAGLTKAPDGLSAPMYGVIRMGPDADGKDGPDRSFIVLVDEPADKDATLYVDSNGNGDLTDDPAAEWKAREQNVGDTVYKQYNGGASVTLGSGPGAFPAHLGMYRFDKNDKARAALKDVLLYYCDYAYEGEVTLGGKPYKAMLTDAMATGDFRGRARPEDAKEEWSSGVRLKLDVNGNGTFDARGEDFDVRRPFNIGGTTYEIADMSPTGDSFRIVKSDKEVPEIPTPPDHSVGKKITPFEQPLTSGTKVKFPGDYKGKVVMLDFWATWCGPCMGEVPGLVEVYNTYHGQGFDILGISLDNEKTKDRLAPVTEEKGMTWPQVCDGKFWKAEIAEMYVIHSIPAAYLVDGDTGEILAAGGSLRGEKLEGTIKAALAKKKAN